MTFKCHDLSVNLIEKKLQKNCAKKLHFRKLHRKSRWAVKIILDEAFVLRKILKMQWNKYGIGIFSHRKVTFWGFYYHKSAENHAFLSQFCSNFFIAFIAYIFSKSNYVFICTIELIVSWLNVTGWLMIQ